MKELVLFPFNGNAREALDAIGDEYKVVAFIDDDKSKHGEYFGIPVQGREKLSELVDNGTHFLAVPGSVNTHRKLKEIIDGLSIPDQAWAKIIHPDASVSRYANIGRNVLIMAGTTVTADAQIGDHCCVLPNCVIHHDVKISSYNTIAAGCLIAGYVEIGSFCYLGVGCRIKNNLKLGARTIVGMGANVISNFAEDSVLIGNPAKTLDR